jgi:hypothetical protein
MLHSPEPLTHLPDTRVSHTFLLHDVLLCGALLCFAGARTRSSAFQHTRFFFRVKVAYEMLDLR